MVKAGKWLRSFLTGKKERSDEKVAERRNWVQLLPPPPAPPPSPPLSLPPSPLPSTPKEKRRRSFNLERKRRAPREGSGSPSFNSGVMLGRSSVASRKSSFSVIEIVAAIKIQASFRSFLARKALRALKGLVKLQAVVRGYLVRKQAVATIRSMQALLAVQVRARATRVRMIQEAQGMPSRDRNQVRTAVESRFQQLHDKERSLGGSKSRNNGQISQAEIRERRAQNYYQKYSSSPSPLTDLRAPLTDLRANARIEELFYSMAESSSSAASAKQHRRMIISSETDAPQDGPCSPLRNYMANTKSWKAKSRSQSTPRQRNDLPDYGRQCYGKHRTSFDGKNLNRAVKEQITWPVLLDRSATIAGCKRFIAA